MDGKIIKEEIFNDRQYSIIQYNILGNGSY